MADNEETMQEMESLDKALAALKQGPPSQPPAEEAKPAEPPPEPLAPPAPSAEAPPVEPKAAEPPIESAEAAGAEQRLREGTMRRLLREQDRKIAALRQEIADLRNSKRPVEATGAEPEKSVTFEEEPEAYLKGQLERNRQELDRLRMEHQALQERSEIERQEKEFERDHPFYRQALNALVTNEVERWQKSGLAAAHQENVRRMVELGGRGDQSFAAWKGHIDTLAQRPDVIELADKENKSPEDVAVFLTARDLYLDARRREVVEGARAAKRNVAETVYALAEYIGYRPPSGTPEKVQEQNVQASREKVLQAQRVAEAANSLSEVSGTGGAGPRVIRKREDILGLSDDELDRLIESRAYEQL